MCGTCTLNTASKLLKTAVQQSERTSGADLPVTAAFRSGVTDPGLRAPHTAPGRLGTLLHEALERAQDKRERGSPGQELWAHTAYGRRQWPRKAPQTASVCSR